YRAIYNACKDQIDAAYEVSKGDVCYQIPNDPKHPDFLKRKTLPTSDSQNKELSQKELGKDFPWFLEVPSQVIQEAAKECHTTYNRLKKGISGFPEYKRRSQDVSFSFPQGIKNARKLSKRRGRVYLPIFGEVDFRWTRPIGKIHSVDVITTLDKWYLNIC